MNSYLTGSNTGRMAEMLAVGNGPTTAGPNTARCIDIEQSQMGSTSFGGNDLVTMTTTPPPDEIAIDRGIRSLVGVVGSF
jgi:hypothetical protein